MAKRTRRTSARKTAASKRVRARKRAKSTPRKSAKRAGGRTRAKKIANRVAVKTRVKKRTTKARAKHAAAEKVTPRLTELPKLPVEATEESVIVDIIEEPVPGVVVVTEFESVQTVTPLPEGSEGSDLAEGKEEDKH